MTYITLIFLIFFGFLTGTPAQAGYVREQGQYLQNFQVANGETGSFEMFISLIKVSLAGVGLILLVIILYSGLHWIFTYSDKKTVHDSGMVFWGAVGAFIGVTGAYIVIDFIFRVLLLNKT